MRGAQWRIGIEEEEEEEEEEQQRQQWSGFVLLDVHYDRRMHFVTLSSRGEEQRM